MKLLTQIEPVSDPSFHFSSSDLQDVFELIVFATRKGYLWGLNAEPCSEYELPVITATITPNGVEARKTEPIVRINDTDFVVWKDGRFIVKAAAEVEATCSVQSVALPDVVPQPDPISQPPAEEPTES